MARFGKNALVGCVVGAFGAALLSATPAARGVVIANFEDGTTDGFGILTNSGVAAFSTQSTVSGTVTTPTTGGDTTKVLDLTASGYNGGLGSGNDLGYDFVASGNAAAFLANDVLTFNWEVAPSATSAGYAQLYNIVINAQGYGYHNVGGSSFTGDTNVTNQYPGYTGQVNTYTLNYDAIKASIPANAGYIQLGITTNNGGGAPPDFYFDNFTLSTVPEPVSTGTLGLAAIGLIGRRYRDAYAK